MAVNYKLNLRGKGEAAAGDVDHLNYHYRRMDGAAAANALWEPFVGIGLNMVARRVAGGYRSTEMSERVDCVFSRTKNGDWPE